MTDSPTGNPAATSPTGRTVAAEVNGAPVEIPDRGQSLLELLRYDCGLNSVKDGCSPQGQCGCCTVIVDGKPRVSCVTPARRINGRSVTTLEGFDPEVASAWADAFCATGASQCGFCTPGIIVRLESMGTPTGDDDGGQGRVDARTDRSEAVDGALLAHLCRCTGWQTIHEAAQRRWQENTPTVAKPGRDLDAAARRAALEGGTAQAVSPDVALGGGGFVADAAPDDALLAVVDGEGIWHVDETLTEARAAAGKVQGRRTTAAHRWPIDLPDGSWDAALRTTWVEPAYLEPDAAWCVPGGEPVTGVANGGAFGARRSGLLGRELAQAARLLADEHGRTVLVAASREEVTQQGPKRPPVAGVMNADGTGIMRVARTPGIAEIIVAAAPGLVVEEVDVPGPPTSSRIRAAGWAEATVLAAGATGVVGDAGVVTAPSGARASASITRTVDGPDPGTVIEVEVECGDVLDEIVLRSYCIGAAHMAWSWLTSEALTVDEAGLVHDLTIRSFGVLRSVDTPRIDVTVRPGSGPPVNGSDAVFVAVAAAGWLATGRRVDWPVGLG